MQRVFPVQQRVVKALRPVLTRAAGVPMPGGSVFGAVERLHAELDEVRDLLCGPDASVRIVLTPEAVVLAEARRAYTTLSLFGYRVDGVVANRVFPAEGADDWRAGWVMAQDAVLAEVTQSFVGVPLWRSEYRATEPVGVAALEDLARALYDGADPVASSGVRSPFEVVSVRSGVQLRLRLPFVTRDQVDLARSGDELVVTVGSYRRLLTLPASLARLQVTAARVDHEGVLRVSFQDPSAGTKTATKERVG
jgi:arsenite-transporting ATPase